jgi:hypothetical protein
VPRARSRDHRETRKECRPGQGGQNCAACAPRLKSLRKICIRDECGTRDAGHTMRTPIRYERCYATSVRLDPATEAGLELPALGAECPTALLARTCRKSLERLMTSTLPRKNSSGCAEGASKIHSAAKLKTDLDLNDLACGGLSSRGGSRFG